MATIEAIRSGMVLDALPGYVGEVPMIGSDERWFVGPGTTVNPEKSLPDFMAMPGRLLYDVSEINRALESIAQTITDQISPKDLCIVALAKGALKIREELLPKVRDRNLAYPVERLTRTITASSYHASTKSNGDVKREGTPGDVKGKTVIILDDILDTGKTVNAVREDLMDQGAKAVRCATLLTKAGALEVDIADLGEEPINGITIPNLFVVGHGIDWAEQFRELDEIVGLDPQRIVRIIQKEVV